MWLLPSYENRVNPITLYRSVINKSTHIINYINPLDHLKKKQRFLGQKNAVWIHEHCADYLWNNKIRADPPKKETRKIGYTRSRTRNRNCARNRNCPRKTTAQDTDEGDDSENQDQHVESGSATATEEDEESVHTTDGAFI